MVLSPPEPRLRLRTTSGPGQREWGPGRSRVPGPLGAEASDRQQSGARVELGGAARAATGRDKIMKFAGGYHGHNDGLLVKGGSGLATLGIPDSPGVPVEYAQNTLVAPYNDAGAVELLFRQYPEAIAEYQEMVEANAKLQLGLILLNKTEILQKVIADGLSDKTTPRDRLAIYKAISELEEGLKHTLPQMDEYEAAAQEFLKHGPVLQQGVSRLSATDTPLAIGDGRQNEAG